MRRYGRIFLILVFIAAGVSLAVPAFLAQTQAWIKHLQAIDVHTLSTTAGNSLVYPVKEKQWLKFALPEDGLQLRIITNAHIQRTEAATPDSNWNYALHYELLDKKGAVLKTGVYNQHSHITTYKDSEDKPVNGNYYLDKDIVPLDGRLILLSLQGLQGVAFLQVSLETNHPAITETAVRVYIPAKISEHELAISWLRMNQTQKDNLAKVSIYPSSLLSANEQANLLKHQWQPLGPMGIEGKNYQTLTLYTLKDLELENLDESIVASGLQTDAQHYGVIPIPEQGGLIALSFKALDGSVLTTPVSLNLQWFGRNKEQRWQQDAVWSEDSGSLDYQLDGGLLVIRPSSPVVVSATLTAATEPRKDITDSLQSIKTYLGSVGVDYGVLHYRQQPTALRIDVRRLFTSASTPEHESVHYQWLNEQQQIIADGELNALDQPSLFDRPGNISEGADVSDPSSYYFKLPAQVSRLRLTSSDPALLVNVYNQPYASIKSQRVPEDAYIANDNPYLQLSWFPLRALNDQSLMQQQAIRWLSGQYRPAEDDPDVLVGQYLWQDYVPQGEVAARYLLSDFIGEQARSEALPSLYCSVPVNRDTQVKLNALDGLHSVSPELIFLRNAAAPFSAELFLNRQKTVAINSIGRQGVIQLPETPLGKQLLRLNTDSGGRWLMNYQAQCAGEQYLKRRAFALNTGAALDFIVDHAAEDELFSARLYSPTDTAERTQIKVDIEPITAIANSATVSTSWTYKNRLYDIRPLATKAMPVLYSQGQSLSNGERFFIALNSDLPAGAYRMRIALAKGATGFITLSQIKAGVHPQRHFYQESALETQ